jgi:hypothetical protein
VSFYTDGGQLSLHLYDAMGTRVRTFASGKHRGGAHEVQLDLGGLRPGNYFVQLEQGTQRITRMLHVQ